MLMLLGWCLSLPTTLYNVPPEHRAEGSNQKLAPDPVIPSSERIANWDDSLVEPPFVPPPPATERQWNYWMMSQRCGTPSYLIFASGCCLLIFALFYAVCDGRSWQLGMFRTLGTNALAAYILHDIAGWIIGPLIPEAASFPQASVAFLPFLALVYGACRLLEWRGWLLRV